jgi:hypothetical protein
VLAWGAGGLFVPWILGFLTSMALNNTLGRAPAFAGESPFAWWVWGVRALIAPLAYISAAIMAYLLVRSAWRLARRMSRVFDAWCNRVAESVDDILVRTRLADLGTRGQLVVLVEAVVLMLLLWRFHELIVAQTALLSEAMPSETSALSPEKLIERAAYGWSLDAFVLIFGGCWLAIARARKHKGLPTWDASVIGGVTAVVLSIVVLWTLPYRVTWHNEFPKVLHGPHRCYIIGQRQNDVLLHCPDVSPPRNRIVARDDRGLKHSGSVESIFTPQAESR